MRVAAVLLAAGAAHRFGGPSKLLVEFDGAPLIHRAARAVEGCGAAVTIAVTGRDAEAVTAALSGFTLDCVYNPAWADGLGGSVATGVRALGTGIDAALIVPGDMSLLTPEFLQEMIRFAARMPEPRPICFAQLPDGTQSNPVLWPKRYFPELMALLGTAGGKVLLTRYAPQTMAFPVTDVRLLMDIDTPDDLVRASALIAARA